ncbi:zinc-binding protein A33-like [Hypanus sabinus]|uniref:zinc-binding protein A33-like n=1 Tax=Hypanus sabinus TaxID=79690 RepID=UPI0028C4A076|nr:zinc-binding protein A33-like [Hypanus sabinus]
MRGCRYLPHLFCPLHEEELKLFCETDGKLICGICRDSREHKYHHYIPVNEALDIYQQLHSHSLIPVNEALDIYQDKLQSHLETARRRRAAALKARLQQRQKISEVREQSSSLQSHIKFEFTRMHRFLNEREEQLSRDLREAEGRILEEMEQNLQQIQDALDAIEHVLGELQSQMNQQDIMALLKEESIWNRRFSNKGNSLEPVDLDLPLGIFKGPLQYAAWRAMMDVIRPVPVPLTLNPDTANPWLVLSEDLHSVRMGQQRRTVPESAERFDRCACVLAMEGFSTGQHYWEVQVGQKTEWDLGVAKKSCQRKGRIRRYPDDGHWRLSLRRQSEYTVFTDPPTLLSLTRSPHTVGIYLDYEGGQLSFYDVDGMIHLHTFTDTFTDTLYPYFCPCLGDGGKNLEAMKICWVKRPSHHKAPETLIHRSLHSDTLTAGSLQEHTLEAILG